MQVKGNSVSRITNEYRVSSILENSIHRILYIELPHELLKDLRLRILGSYKMLGKSSNLAKTQQSIHLAFSEQNFANDSQNFVSNICIVFSILSNFT